METLPKRDEEKYEQSYGSVLIFLFGYLALIIVEYLDDGLTNFNWIGILFLGVLVVLGTLRITKFGGLEVKENSLWYYDILFRRRSVAIGGIVNVDIGGPLTNGLEIYCRADAKSEVQRIFLGSFSKPLVEALTKTLKAKNSEIVVGPRLSRMLKQTHDTMQGN